MSGATIAALVAAGALVVFVLVVAVPLLKLGRTLDEATLAIRKAHEGAVPLLADAQATLRGVNAQLDQVDGITKGVTSMTTNAAALTSLVMIVPPGRTTRVSSANATRSACCATTWNSACRNARPH